MAHSMVIPRMMESAIRKLRDRYDELRKDPKADASELKALKKEIEAKQENLNRISSLLDPFNLP